MNKIDLTDFLTNENLNNLVIENSNIKYNIIKEKISNILFLYCKESYKNRISYDILLSSNDYKFIGFFDTNTNTIYDLDYMFTVDCNKHIINNDNTSILKEIRQEMEKRINNYIEDNLNEFLNHSIDYKDYDIENDVRERYIKNSGFYDYKCNITILDDISLCANYLIDKKATLQIYFDNYIKEYIESLERFVCIRYLKNEALKELIEKPLNLKINKDIYQSLKDVEAKTINIYIDIDGDTVLYKAEKSKIERNLLYRSDFDDWGASWKEVENALIRHNRKKYESISFDRILKITYRKNVLYERS